MNDVKDAKLNPLKQFWDRLDDHGTVMLGSPAPDQPMQPMAANGAREEGLIWFYTRKDTDLAQAANSGGRVQMCLMDEGRDYYAAVVGQLDIDHSERHIERYWNAVEDAVYSDGRQDPQLTMLKFAPETASVWVGTGNPVKFGWELARSTISGKEPNLGFSTQFGFQQNGA